MPCCQQPAFFYGITKVNGSAREISLPVAVEESSLPLIFSYCKSYNNSQVELKPSVLCAVAMVRFLYLEAALQQTIHGTPGPYEGMYVGQAVFERQVSAGPLEQRQSWLPLLLALFSGG